MTFITPFRRGFGPYMLVYVVRHLQKQIDPTSKDIVFLHATAAVTVSMYDGTLLAPASL